MKNAKLSLLAFALLILSTVTLTSCGGDEEEKVEPKPIIEKTDLEKVKENIVGLYVVTLSAEVSTPDGLVSIADLCDPGAGFENSVESMSFLFTDSTNVHITNKCVGGETDLSYTITQSGEVFTIQMKNLSGMMLVNADFKKGDFIDGTGAIFPQFKGTFHEITSPKNWEKSPVITLKIQG